MDQDNIRRLFRIIGEDPLNKIHLLLEFAGKNRSIADPWYTDDFETTYHDLSVGLDALLQFLSSTNV